MQESAKEKDSKGVAATRRVIEGADRLFMGYYIQRVNKSQGISGGRRGEERISERMAPGARSSLSARSGIYGRQAGKMGARLPMTYCSPGASKSVRISAARSAMRFGCNASNSF